MFGFNELPSKILFNAPEILIFVVAIIQIKSSNYINFKKNAGNITLQWISKKLSKHAYDRGICVHALL